MVPLVAVVEAHLEFHPLNDLEDDPVGLPEAETIDQERVGFVERGGGEDDEAEPDPLGQEAGRHQR